jgi:hypothetical protein
MLNDREWYRNQNHGIHRFISKKKKNTAPLGTGILPVSNHVHRLCDYLYWSWCMTSHFRLFSVKSKQSNTTWFGGGKKILFVFTGHLQAQLSVETCSFYFKNRVVCFTNKSCCNFFKLVVLLCYLSIKEWTTLNKVKILQLFIVETTNNTNILVVLTVFYSLTCAGLLTFDWK